MGRERARERAGAFARLHDTGLSPTPAGFLAGYRSRVARSIVSMAQRRRRTRRDEDREAEIDRRFEVLEDRMRLLETRLRELSRAPKVDPPAQKTAKHVAARVRPRPRCPGCTLELPKGRRGDSCVWCGFMFSAVGRRALR